MNTVQYYGICAHSVDNIMGPIAPSNPCTDHSYTHIGTLALSQDGK